MRSIPVPDAVRAALVDQSGPYHAQLELVRAVEAESVFDIRAAAEADDARVARGQSRRAACAGQCAAARLISSPLFTPRSQP